VSASGFVDEGDEEFRFRARCKRNETIARAEPIETPMELPTAMVCSLQVLRVTTAEFDTEEDKADPAVNPRLFAEVADESVEVTRLVPVEDVNAVLPGDEVDVMVSVMVETIVDIPPVVAARVDPALATKSPAARVKVFPEQQSSGDASAVEGQQKRLSPQGRTVSNAVGFTAYI